MSREIASFSAFGHSLLAFSSGSKLKLPEAIDDELLSNEIGETRAQPEGIPSSLEPYIQNIKLHEILSRVCDQPISNLVKNYRDNSFDIERLLRLDRMIVEWRDALPAHLQYNSSDDDASCLRLGVLNQKSARQSTLHKQAKKLHLRYAGFEV